MGYKNKKTGYRDGLLESRAVIEPGRYAILPHDGLVKNSVPGFENVNISILASPRLGATFSDFLCEFLKDGKNELGFGGDGIESFVYVISGKLEVSDGCEAYILEDGGYAFFPGEVMYFKNAQDDMTETFLYQRKYDAIEGHKAYRVVGNQMI